MTETPEQSDQLPEEGPAEQVPRRQRRLGEDESPGQSRARRGPATGNPDAAGADEEG